MTQVTINPGHVDKDEAHWDRYFEGRPTLTWEEVLALDEQAMGADDGDRLAKLMARQRAVEAELEAIDIELAEIERERFPVRRPVLTVVQGGRD